MKSPTQFIKETQLELKKVTWPTKDKTIQLTGVVIIVSLIVSIYLGAMDYLFTQLVRVVLE